MSEMEAKREAGPGSPKVVSREELKEAHFTGWIAGEEFSGEWLDGSVMEGCGIFRVEDGEISEFGEFSEDRSYENREKAGDLIESKFSDTFEILREEAEA